MFKINTRYSNLRLIKMETLIDFKAGLDNTDP